MKQQSIHIGLLLFAVIFLFHSSLTAQSTENMKIIENFEKPDKHSWQIINDGVMGGVSKSQLEISDNIGIFSGNLSLENNGGFASTRASIRVIEQDSIQHIRIRVFGDGKKYQFRTRTNNNFDGTAYRAFFQTKNNEWTEHQFKAQDFVAVFRGMRVPQAPRLKLNQIQQIGFLISEKQEGSFTLKIDWIGFK